MRIGIAGIVQEALIFSPIKATARDFAVLRGPEVIQHLGVDDTLRELGMEPVPVLYATHLTPSGIVEESAYVGWRDEIVAGLRAAGPLDGVCLVLHGAMTVENIWNGETDLVREIRAALGNDIPIVARLDPHANITEEFANKVDTWAAYRTAPHRDAHETLERALHLLARRVRLGHRTHPAFIRLPLLLPGERATTPVEPMKSLLGLTREIESQPGILNAEVMIGFGWSDTPHSGSSVSVVAEDDARLPAARRAARRLAQAMWDRRHDFTYDQEVAPGIDEAIDRALVAPERSVFLTDGGDNVTAGAPGDSTLFLARLLARRVPDAVVVGLPDPEVVELCLARGVGATVSVALAGKLAMPPAGPLPVTGLIEHLYEPPAGSAEAAIATLRVDGVHVLVTSRRATFASPEDIQKGGIDPLDHKIVVIKLGYLLPRLRDAAPREILTTSPGYSDLDFTRLPYRYVNRPILPLDPDLEWHPRIT
ncbi:MAG: M81 family metallopeptidase, partial [Chloroflexota bacterium]